MGDDSQVTAAEKMSNINRSNAQNIDLDNMLIASGSGTELDRALKAIYEAKKGRWEAARWDNNALIKENEMRSNEARAKLDPVLEKIGLSIPKDFVIDRANRAIIDYVKAVDQANRTGDYYEAVKNVNALKALKVTGGTLSANVQVQPFNRELRYGNTGDDVKALQDKLRMVGEFHEKSTGNFYAKTEAALRAFQRNYGLRETGVADGATMEKLNHMVKERQSSPKPTSVDLCIPCHTSRVDVPREIISEWETGAITKTDLEIIKGSH